MITEWTTPFVEKKDEFVDWLKTQANEDDLSYPSYLGLLSKALEIVCAQVEFPYGDKPDIDRIHRIDDGDYQGTLVFVIGADGYQPSTYWYTDVSYGSCSGCDALEAAWGYGDDCNYEGLYLIALHMLQRAKEMT